jgi:hypothetical protein
MFDAIYHATTFEHERSTNKEFCIPYDKKSMAGHSTALDQMVNEYFLYGGLKVLLPKKSPKTAITAEARIKRELRSLFWHFLQAMRVHNDCYVRICLREISYRKSLTDNPHGISREIGKVVSALEECGAITRCKGFLDRRSGKSKQTRIRPRQLLLDDLKTLPTDIVEDFVEPSPVSIRKGIVGTLDHASEAHLTRMENTIARQNEVLRRHSITLPCAKNGYLTFLDKDDEQRCVKVTGKSVCAIYHADTPDKFSYGRIHGGMWQRIPSRYRHQLCIDGEQTFELDYSAQVVHIVAGLSGIQLTDDPYTLALDIPYISAKTQREIVKTVVVVALNASDRKSLVRGVRGKIRKLPWETRSSLSLTDKSLEPIIDAVLNALPYLEPYVLQGKGKHLFMHDAEIARQIIHTFLDAGKVVLPIHDGFVVKRSDREFLWETMERVWFEMFGTTIPIKAESKNT